MAAITYDASSSSSSSSSSSIPRKYQVFLSFCGKDTFKTFTGHLRDALERSCISTYMANLDLEQGDKIWPALVDAIKESKIFIPIFSQNYGSSKWCLNELVQAMECRQEQGQLIMPIFYHVDPRDVRNQMEEFGRGFEDLAIQFEEEMVNKWKAAMKEAGEMKGWDLNADTNGNEWELVQRVVKEVSKKLEKTFFDLPENLVGIRSHLEELLNLLNLKSEETKIIGIWGMGGIGKTTIAEAIFNQICCNFEEHIFLNVIIEASKQDNGLVGLQKRLLGNEIQLISNINEGKHRIKERLSKKKVLIVLDNVDDIKQLKALADHSDWFGKGSKILITTRDKKVLNGRVDKPYELKELNYVDSFHLFSRHAFGNDKPPGDLLKLVHNVVDIAGGLPLVLEVLGSSMFGERDLEAWRSTLDRLKKVPDRNVFKTLKITYDGLVDFDKAIFLDIACFFIGADREHVVDILESCRFSAKIGIKNLIDKSLIKIYQNKLLMHDQLRDMGRHIVCQENPNEPGMRSRLWSQDEVLNVLDKREVRVECMNHFLLRHVTLLS